ncbi:MAG: metallophosphoesterase [Phycisphaerae bacterium]|nr:FN3 domain-containing metallophosphoesterase family protein [Tepidisphaeraceae bacterium]
MFPDPTRRQLLTGLLTAGAVLSATGAADAADAPPPPAPGALVDSPPVLQNPSSTGVTVVWAVSAPATGWVEYGSAADKLDRRAVAPTFGLLPFSDRFISARLDGLEPGKTIHYRAVTRPVNFRTAYKIEAGEPIAGPTFTFTPPDPAAAKASFAVINDTHEQTPTLKQLTDKLAADPADFTVWNGDVFNDIRTDDQVVAQVLRPAGAAYASQRPVLFTSGNHDVRGVAARGLSRAVSPWPEHGPLGRSFTLRHGPLAIVGLDTGEDKPDHHPAWGGLAAFEPYRVAQAAWLAAALKRPEIASAPFLVVFCHIPLWGLPEDNPGDTLEGYASYSRHSQTLWHPALAASGAQLLVCGHTHKYRYDPPAEGRPYGQLVGGGPKLTQATLIRGAATADKLTVTATDLAGKQLGAWTFAARKG